MPQGEGGGHADIGREHRCHPESRLPVAGSLICSDEVVERDDIRSDVAFCH